MLAVACRDIAGLVYVNTQPGLREKDKVPSNVLQRLKDGQRILCMKPTMIYNNTPTV